MNPADGKLDIRPSVFKRLQVSLVLLLKDTLAPTEQARFPKALPTDYQRKIAAR